MKTKRGSVAVVAIAVGLVVASVIASSFIYLRNEYTLSVSLNTRLADFYNCESGLARIKAELQRDVYYLNDNQVGTMGLTNFSYNVSSVSINDSDTDTTIDYNISCNSTNYTILTDLNKTTGVSTVNLQQ